MLTYANLGISRPRCFVMDTSLFSNLSSSNTCAARLRCGWRIRRCPRRRARVGTVRSPRSKGPKIIPDGLLTPGSHVQYFFRKSQIFGYAGYAMDPGHGTISAPAVRGQLRRAPLAAVQRPPGSLEGRAVRR